MDRWVAAIAVLVVGAFGCGDDATKCKVHADCNGSPEADEAGRCGPELACIQGECAAWCPQDCSTTDDTVPPCEQGFICTEASNTPLRPRCRATEIPCDEADECPLYRPGAGEWSCEQGICRFPGFTYLYENP